MLYYKKHLKKTKCKACGTAVIVGRTSQKDAFPRPLDGPTCRTIGVEKAIEQRLRLKAKSVGIEINIKDGKEQMKFEHRRKMINKEQLLKDAIEKYEGEIIDCDSEAKEQMLGEELMEFTRVQKEINK